jgi:hypothetical protein
MNILFADGHVAFYPTAEAMRELERTGAITPQP